MGKAGFEAEELPAELVGKSICIVKRLVDDKIPSADEFDNARIIALFEAGEAFAGFTSP